MRQVRYTYGKSALRLVVSVAIALCIAVPAVVTLRVVGRERLNGQLIDAVRADDAPGVAALLDRGADADAVAYRSSGLMDYLVLLMVGGSHGAPRHALDVAVSRWSLPAKASHAYSAASQDAWSRNNAAIVEMLLNHGAVLRGYRNQGSIPSPLIASMDRPLTMRVLLQHGARADAASVGPGYGHDLLRLAIASYKLPTEDIVALAHAGADLNGGSKPAEAGGPLNSALYAWRWDVVKALLQLGADPALGQPNAINVLKQMIHDSEAARSDFPENAAVSKAFLPDARATLAELLSYAEAHASKRPAR